MLALVTSNVNAACTTGSASFISKLKAQESCAAIVEVEANHGKYWLHKWQALINKSLPLCGKQHY